MADASPTRLKSRGFISVRLHGILDYLEAAALLILPWLLPYGDHQADRGITVTFGAVILAYSAVTNYELGLLRVLPFSVHRFLDIGVSFLLLAAPWHFESRGAAAVIMVIFGIVGMGVVIFTDQPRQMQQSRLHSCIRH